MSLIHEFERTGNFLFRYRGQIPVIFFLLSAPVVCFTEYAWLSPSRELLLIILALGLSVSGILIRAYTIGTTPAGTSGRNTEEQVAEQLNSTGIYSVVRHPLYLGNYLMWAGLLVYTGHFWFVGIISLVYWIYYERIMFAEERFLEKKFGQAYIDWSLSAPAFFPRLRQFIKSRIPFSFRSVLRREYSGWLAAAFGFFFIDGLRMLCHQQTPGWSRWSVVFFAVFIIVALVLRTIKHRTRLLHEEGRS